VLVSEKQYPAGTLMLVPDDGEPEGLTVEAATGFFVGVTGALVGATGFLVGAMGAVEGFAVVFEAGGVGVLSVRPRLEHETVAGIT
jgi:hypothetical protein